MQSHANSLARIESDWTLRDGVNSLISNLTSALIIYVNLQLLFLSLFESFLNMKMASDDTETSFDFTSVDFYLFLYNETFTYKNKKCIGNEIKGLTIKNNVKGYNIKPWLRH